MPNENPTNPASEIPPQEPLAGSDGQGGSNQNPPANIDEGDAADDQGPAQRLEKDIRSGERWLIGFTAVGVAINICIGYFYYSQLGQMREATKAATKSAQAAVDSYESSTGKGGQIDRTMGQMITQTSQQVKAVSAAQTEAEVGKRQLIDLEKANAPNVHWINSGLGFSLWRETDKDHTAGYCDVDLRIENQGPGVATAVEYAIDSWGWSLNPKQSPPSPNGKYEEFLGFKNGPLPETHDELIHDPIALDRDQHKRDAHFDCSPILKRYGERALSKEKLYFSGVIRFNDAKTGNTISNPFCFYAEENVFQAKQGWSGGFSFTPRTCDQ